MEAHPIRNGADIWQLPFFGRAFPDSRDWQAGGEQDEA
ncbi:hypothetical protein B14911_05846 [Bacillus sp. NRRL B-14911]|nr:hypothetical protein B14911_05846 [Bacillus sp. NRRL B-14911]